MAEETSYHMTPDEFRRRGRELVDWIADYQERVASLPVFPKVQPGEIRAALPAEAPEQGESFDVVLRDLEEIIMPGLTHWQSPNFYGFFPSNNSGPSILGELLSAGLSVHAMMWTTSPAATELETHVLDWLVDLLDLPAAFRSDSDGGGVIEDTASSATLCALIAARERVTDFASNDDGCDGRIVAYTSSQAHLSVEKAIKIAGLGRQNLRLIDVDASFAMCPEHLAQRIKDDREARLLPAFVCATVGTTASNGLDPLDEIGRICTKANVWLHVDAAMSGTAALCPEFRHIHDGLEFADSYCFNPHKWMFTNFDCNVFWVADRGPLLETLSILPPYLRNAASDSGEVVDYRDWHVPLGRRFRALKLWWVLRSYGAEGIRHHIREHIRMAQALSARLQSDSRFEVISPTDFALVCFRHVDGDEATNRITEKINVSGRAMLTASRIDDRAFVRVSVGQTRTEQRHVDALWEMIDDFA